MKIFRAKMLILGEKSIFLINSSRPSRITRGGFWRDDIYRLVTTWCDKNSPLGNLNFTKKMMNSKYVRDGVSGMKIIYRISRGCCSGEQMIGRRLFSDFWPGAISVAEYYCIGMFLQMCNLACSFMRISFHNLSSRVHFREREDGGRGMDDGAPACRRTGVPANPVVQMSPRVRLLIDVSNEDL